MKKTLSAIALAALSCLTASAQKTAQVAIFSLNDFHCGMVQDLRKEIPGAAWVVQTLDSLKSVYPNNVTISAGDNFGGSFFYSATREESLLPTMFRDMDIRISVPGNHAFDEGQERWADGWQSTALCPRDWKLQYVCANIRKGGRIPDVCQPWAVVPVTLKEGGTVSVAITGLMTSNTPNQASARRLTGLTFDGNYSAVLDSLKTLPGYEEVERANIHILATHIGTYLKDGVPTYDDPDAANLMAFDRTDIDGIFTAHSHVALSGTMPSRQPYPIVQGYCRGMYIAMLLCDVDLESGRCVKVTPSIVKVNPHAALAPKAARLQAQVEEQYQTTCFRGLPLSRVLTHSRCDIRHERSINHTQTRMGTLVTESYAEAYRQATQASDGDIVVGISHFGSMRAGFFKGDVTVLDVGEALPFANPLKAYSYTGRQLRQLMEFGINGCRLGRIQASGIEVKTDKKGHVKTMTFTSGDGSDARSVSITDNTRLVIVTDDYITTGGDGYDPAFFPEGSVLPVQMPVSTDAFIGYLSHQTEI